MARRIFTCMAVDADGDVDTSGGGARLEGDLESVVQNLTCRLRMFKGEWFLNTEEGMPYFQSILVKNPNTNLLRSFFTEAILGTPLVTEVNDLNFEYDGATRSLSVSFNFTVVISGVSTTLDYNKTFVIGVV